MKTRMKTSIKANSKTRRVIMNKNEIRAVNHPVSDGIRQRDRRQGSTIIVVLALLMALLTLGFLFLTLASQAGINAEYYVESQKVKDESLDFEPIFQEAIDQIFRGPSMSANNPTLANRQTVLYGGYTSFLANMYGDDLHPFSGQGINLMAGGQVDMDYNGTADAANGFLGTLNHSPTVTGIDRADTTVAEPFQNFPQPDVPYTYGDHTSLFLSYDYFLPNGGPRVIVPSYFRPQLMRETGVAANVWHSDPLTSALSMRPHTEHFALLQNGTPALDLGGANILRYIRTKAEANAIAASLGQLPGTIRPFPFPANENDTNGNGIVDLIEDINANGVFDQIAYGVWSGQGSIYQFDVDNDGDGVKESIWLDLGLPTYIGPDGKKFIPMVSIMVKELDSLININVHGNNSSFAGLRTNNSGTTGQIVGNFGGGNFLHHSNKGVRRSEVNPQYALFTSLLPSGDPSLGQHTLYLANDLSDPSTTREPQNALELANLEWFWILTGRPELEVNTATNSIDVNSMIPGRWGEQGALGNGNASAQDAWNPLLAAPFPAPGLTTNFSGSNLVNADDNSDLRRGAGYNDPSATVFPTALNFLPWKQPLDLFGSGTNTLAGTPTQRLFRNVGDGNSAPFHRFAQYNSVFWNSGAVPQYPYLVNPIDTTHHDESTEMFIEPSLAGLQTSDAAYPPSTSGILQYNNAILASLGLNNDRILKLAPTIFGTSGPNAATSWNRRKLTAADTWDMKSLGKPQYKSAAFDSSERMWEFNLNTNATPVLEFPPTFPISTGVDPFRPELRELLRIVPRNPNVLSVKRPQRKLSVNEILDRDLTDGRLRFRPLTPHPQAALTNTPVTSLVVRPNLIANVDDQEKMARFDRQRLCRDIYVMLYTFGGGPDVNYTTSNAGNLLYSDLQLREMAQFAVNMVDYADSDDVITKFEYDTDLSNGWNLDDNAFSDVGELSAERGFVYGKEAQKLVLNEAMVLLAKKVETLLGTPENHEATEYDDTLHRDFLSFELQTVTRDAVPFANEAWQIRITQVPAPADPTGALNIINERRLLLRSAAGSVPGVGMAKSQKTIFTAGDNHNLNLTLVPPVPHSLFRVNPLYKDDVAPNHNNPADMTQIMPRTVGVNDIDLIARTMLPDNTFIVYGKPALGKFGDGPKIAPVPTGNDASDLLSWIDPINGPDTVGVGNVKLRIELRRRVDLRRAPPVIHLDFTSTTAHQNQSQDNPWVTVDEIVVDMGVFNLLDQARTMKNNLREKLVDSTRSLQRTQPLYGKTLSGIASNDRYFVNPALRPTIGGIPNPTYDPTVLPASNRLNYRFNSLSGSSIPTVTPFTIWEPHPNRPFASIAELFDVPLYGPAEATTGNFRDINGVLIRSIPSMGRKNGAGTLFKINRSATAGNKIVNPNITAIAQVGNLGTSPPSTLGNRWYRLFEFLEVPDVDPHSAVGPSEFPFIKRLMEKPWFVTDAGRNNMPNNQLGFYRTPGKLNINMIHHPTILAGLLDDPNALEDGLTNPLLNDRTDPTRTNRWLEFLRSRDGIDTAFTNLPLPGVPGKSRPFRDFSNSLTLDGAGPLEHTLLRGIEVAGGTLNPQTPGRRLFELGTTAQNTAWPNSATIDYTTRYRLLNKVMNNTTKRSNVFAVWVTVGLFEVTEIEASNSPLTGGEFIPRIGGEIGGEANGVRHQQFYIIDRSKAHSSLQAGDLPKTISPTAGGNYFIWSFNENYNLDRSILYKQTIK